MRIQIYLRVVSDETTVRALDKEAAIQGTTVKSTRARPAEGDVCWSWQTDYFDVEDDVDAGVRKFLTQHGALFPKIRKLQGPEADIYLEVVTRCKESERAPGLYLSSESISLLAELGAALDNDIVLEV